MDALHPRLCDEDSLAPLREAWNGNHVRVERCLVPGLAAELRAAIEHLPCTAQHDEDQQWLSWRCQVQAPDTRDPQHPHWLHDMVTAARVEIPALVSALASLDGKSPTPQIVDVHRFKKGSFAKGGRPPQDGYDALLWLTGARWPRAWGGWLELADDSHAPAWDCIDIVRGDYQIALVDQHVSSTLIRFRMEPAS